MDVAGFANFIGLPCHRFRHKCWTQKQVTRQGAQYKAEALPEAWRVLLRQHLGEDGDQSNNEALPETEISSYDCGRKGHETHFEPVMGGT